MRLISDGLVQWPSAPQSRKWHRHSRPQIAAWNSCGARCSKTRDRPGGDRMNRDELDQRLSRMSTMWTMVIQAHGSEAAAANAALAGLAQRYSAVVYRYLLGAVRDPDTAAELSQEFAIRILQGAFRRADPGRGRFRDYLKTALIHLVNDYHRARQARPMPLPADVPASAEPAGPDAEVDFLDTWRAELLDRTWKALEAAQPTYYAVLRFRVENPDSPSPEMAERLGARLGTAMRPDQVRKSAAAVALEVCRIAGRRGCDVAGEPVARRAGRRAACARFTQVLPFRPGATSLTGSGADRRQGQGPRRSEPESRGLASSNGAAHALKSSRARSTSKLASLPNAARRSGSLK